MILYASVILFYNLKLDFIIAFYVPSDNEKFNESPKESQR